jgi:hypothetical protein
MIRPLQSTNTLRQQVFIANLTTFTCMKEINDADSLKLYIGFFAFLWITWYYLALFDLRFSTDSIFERVAKALHIGVIIGFAVVCPTWPSDKRYITKSYKMISFLIMASRLVLASQYAVALFFWRKLRLHTSLPLALTCMVYIISGVLYGSMTPMFMDSVCSAASVAANTCKLKTSSACIAWDIIGVAEIICKLVATRNCCKYVWC